jgi:hypothetical protein
MQRLHEEDLAGHVLDRYGDQFHHIMLPMEYDPSRACPADIRTYEGQLLWEEQWSREAVERTKVRLGPFGVAGQFQQSPAPRGGSIIGIPGLGHVPRDGSGAWGCAAGRAGASDGAAA